MADGLPPGVTVVSRMAAEGGGEWVLGSDGGVFAIGGAQFYGAYTTLGGQDPTRKFSNISGTVEGGYVLTDVQGHTYHFNPPATSRTAPTADAPTAAIQAPIDPNAPAPPSKSGAALLTNFLADYGLDKLGERLLSYYRGEGGGSVDATLVFMRDQAEYKTRFAGMEAREKAGYAPVSEEEYIQWEGTTKSLFNHYGLPASFYDQPEELAAFIAGDVSPAELKDRIENGYFAAMSAPQEVRDSLQSMYGVGPEMMAAFFLDPDKGEKIIQQRFTAAQVGGQAMKSGFGSLTAAEGETLAAGGMTSQEAQGAFGTLVQGSQLTEGMSREEQLAAAGGDVAAGAQITTAATKKKAAFGGGGEFATGKEGISGLGTSNS